ncbi:MAG TPA: AAA family ATPase [Trueperaceae bacterium]|nr:AAA family ATPase [Trueperaceae bacterium]
MPRPAVPASPFVGRDAELAALLACWEAVKGGEGPRAVALLAESGLGKTRLVQELYAALVQREQGGVGYWPSGLRRERDDLKVNPGLDECDLNAQLPFLWWALRLTNPGERNRATAGVLMSHVTDHLVPHLEPFQREQRRRQRLVKLAKLGAGTAADAALDLVPVLGIVKKVAEVGAELKGIHDEWRRDATAGDALAGAAARRSSLASDVVTDLSRLFGAPGGRAVPAVIVVDDGQFSAADPGACALVEALLKAAADEGWPLLFVLTHWEREWADGSSPLARVFEASADEGVETVALRIEPIEDLSEQLRAALPGLLPHQERALLDRAGGNPLLLDEMLRAALSPRARGWFAGRDLAGPLTDGGLRELVTRSGRLVDLVFDRFAETAADVQVALGLAALQGDEFEDWLVEEALHALGREQERRTADAVAEAANPHALVARLSYTRAAFSQRVYREVARDSLVAFVDEAEALTAYLSGLKAIALGERPLPDAGQLPTFHAALAHAFEFDLDDPDSPRLAATGLSGMIGRARDVGDLETAAALAARMVRVLDRLDDGELDGDLWWLRAPVSALFGMGMDEEARPLLVRLVRLAGEAYEDDANDWSGPLYAQALLDVADFYSRGGEDRKSVESLAMALDVIADPALSPDDPEVLEAAIRAVLAYEANASRRGDLAKAEEALSRAHALMETLAEVDPGPWRSAQSAAVGVRLGRIALVNGRVHEAVKRLVADTGVLEELLAHGPDADIEVSLLQGYHLLGQALGLAGDSRGAGSALRSALRIARQRQAAAPGATEPTSEVADALEGLSKHLRDAGDAQSAWPHATEAMELRRRVHAAGATDATLRLGANLTLLSELAWSREEPNLAQALASEAIALLRSCERHEEEEPDLRVHWFLLLALLAAVPATAAVNGTDAARALLAEASDEYERVSDRVEVPDVADQIRALEEFLAGR